jgi:hypothetical protein
MNQFRVPSAFKEAARPEWASDEEYLAKGLVFGRDISMLPSLEID